MLPPIGEGGENFTEVLWESLRLAIHDFIDLLPRILIALIVVFIYLLVMKYVNKLVGLVMGLLKADELIRPLTKEARISLTKIIIVLVDIGLILLAIYTIIYIVFPEQIYIADTILLYTAKYGSVVFIILLSYIILGSIVRIIRAETKIRGFMFLLLLFVTLILTIDITALSDTVKQALSWGISIGIAALIACFSAWYFFHDIIARKREGEK